MGEFGWAYISGSAPLQSAGGASGSVQFKAVGGGINGSEKLVYKDQIHTLELTGTLKVEGAITASSYHIESITNLDAAGSSNFGNSTDDTHVFTGSMYVGGPVSASHAVSASFFYGNGAHLTNLPAGVITGFNNGASGRIVTSANSTTLQGEADLTWAGANLQATGAIYASGIISGSTLHADGQHIDNLNATEITHGTLDNARLPASINVTNISAADGSGINQLNASNISTGTLNSDRLPSIPNAKLPSEVSVTTVTGSTGLSGSALYAQTGKFSRDVTVEGTLTAYRMNVKATGDTIIGDNAADEHQFTGSVHFAGPVSASTGVSASVLIGNGAQITGLPPYGSPAIATFTDSTANRLVSVVDSDSVRGTSGLTWDNSGLNLEVTGAVWASQTVSGSALYGGGLTAVNQKVGIGTASPAQKLTIDTGNIQLTNGYQLQWGDADTAIFGNASSDYVRVKTAGLDRFTIDSSGKVGVGTINPDHKLAVAGDVSASVNISASAFYGDGSNLTNVSSPLTIKEEGSNITTSAASINFVGAYVTASTSGDDVTVTVNAGAGGSTIGAAEDGSYTDGLFTDFVTSTPVGTAVDKFNEVLKILAPSPAPSLQHIGVSTGNGQTAKLSFGASAPVGGVASHSTTAGWSPAVDRNGSYAPATDGYKKKLGVYQSTDITGIINYDIAASVTNGNYAYREDSFGNGETGTLKLELNGSTLHSINLATFTGAGTPPNGTDDTGVNGNGSGFLDVSTAASTLDGNGADWGSIFKYRSAKYVIRSADMRAGWNYLRVIHTVGGNDAASNYIEWINETDTNPLKVFIPRIENVNLVGSKYLSGVKYNTDATANYKANLNNMYRNVYPDSGTPISFSATNSANPSSVAVASLGGGDDNTKIIQLTASLDCSVTNLLNGSIACNLSATHPIKSNISNTGSATASGFLIDNRSLASDGDTENFHDETFRKTSGSYDTQNSVIHDDATWNPQTHMLSAAGHDDGLMMYDQALRSPKQGPNSGNFSTLANGPGGNPNYSGVSGVRTFYRVLTASTGQAYDVRVTTTQGGTTFNNSALGTGNMHMFVKIPGTTGWMDATQDFSYGEITDYAGALNPTATNTSTVRYLTFGTASVANDDHIMFKFVADASWTGNVSTVEFDPNVSTATNAAALSTIDVDNSGTNAKLSFGTSNAVGSYIPVTGSGIGSMSTVDSNGAYTLSGNRRAIFNSYPTVTGDVNGNGGQFRNAYDGTLVLEVNGIEVHSVNLHTLTSIPAGGGYDANGNGSGFDLSALAWRQGPANANDYRYPYRTGTYKVATADQRLGWNTVRVIHRHGGDTTTTYGQWVVDTDNSTMASSSVNLPNFFHDELYYQSGVGYFAQQPSASFALAASNVYRNVYHNGSTGITFPTATRCTVTNTRAEGAGVTTLDEAGNSKSLPALNNSANCEQQVLNITGNVRYNTTDSIVDQLSLFTDYDVQVNCLVKHPFKTNLQTTTYTKDKFMYHSGSLAGTTNLNTREDFQLETYRIASNAYANQAAVTAGAQTWNSSYSVDDATYSNHQDGMVTIKGYLISPLKIGASGDTRNTAQGGTLQAPNGNPNYSSLTNATRTYYRYFRNESGVAAATPTITLYGDANIVAKSGAFYTGALGANKNINVEIKVPYDPSFTGLDDASTAWGDCVKPYSAGVQPTSDGVGVYGGGGSGLNQTVGGSGRAIGLQLQQSMIRDDQYIVVKITAHKDWTGYLSRIDIAY